MSKQLTILFHPMEGVGHVNACIGMAQVLQSRGHKIVFVVGKEYEGKLVHYGFREELLQTNNKKEEEKEKYSKPGEHATDLLMRGGLFAPMSSFESMKAMSDLEFFDESLETAIKSEPQIKAIVEKYKPDIYIMDQFIGSPTLIYSNKPWVNIYSANPLFYIKDERSPPGGSGFPTNGDNNSKEWKEFRELSNNVFAKMSKSYNKWLKENQFPTIDNKRCIPDSPYLNIYQIPEELDYTDIRPIPDKWFQVDTFSRKEVQEFSLPEILKNRNEDKQKLIYLSLGSMGSGNVKLMKRLVNILSKSQHKFIVSKGVFGDKYELADNMWGQNSVPQTKVLPFVDLVITHGGNNTITETFSFGKPMIVMPLFGDQFDNAQRVHEKGFGVRMDAHNCTEQELLEAIEKLLINSELKNRLNAVSKRMANSQSLIKAAELIENLVG